MNGTRSRELLLGLASIVFFVLVLAAGSLWHFRLDLTRNRAFSIAEATRELFRGTGETINLTYYVSEKLKRLSPAPQQVEDLLREYEAASHGRLRMRIVDPASEKSEQAVQKLGVAPQQVQVIERDEKSVSLVYSGIVISYLDSVQTLPLVHSVATLEYDLTSRIRSLLRGGSRTVGLLAGPALSGVSSFQLLAGRLARAFSVRELAPGEAVPDDLAALFVLGGRNLAEKELQPIDSFIRRGGRTLFAVDGVEIDINRNLAAVSTGQTALLRLLAAYGVSVRNALVLDASARRIPVQRPVGQVQVQALELYPLWVAAQASGISRVHPLTARFQGLDFLWPSLIETAPPPGVAIEVLAASSRESWVMREPFVTSPFQLQAWQAKPGDAQGVYPLAVALTGIFAAHYPANQSIEARPGRMIVTGSSAMASDLVQYSDSLYNLAFLENAADWLAADEALLAIKTRQARDSRLTGLSDARTRMGAIITAELVNLVLVPLLVVGFGLARALRRREASREKGGPA